MQTAEQCAAKMQHEKYYRPNIIYLTMITRAHSFPWATEF